MIMNENMNKDKDVSEVLEEIEQVDASTCVTTIFLVLFGILLIPFFASLCCHKQTSVSMTKSIGIEIISVEQMNKTQIFYDMCCTYGSIGIFSDESSHFQNLHSHLCYTTPVCFDMLADLFDNVLYPTWMGYCTYMEQRHCYDSDKVLVCIKSEIDKALKNQQMLLN